MSCQSKYKINNINFGSNSYVYNKSFGFFYHCRLTRARLISVSRTLPEKCPFDTYNDLRRHWKNMVVYLPNQII